MVTFTILHHWPILLLFLLTSRSDTQMPGPLDFWIYDTWWGCGSLQHFDRLWKHSTASHFIASCGCCYVWNRFDIQILSTSTNSRFAFFHHHLSPDITSRSLPCFNSGDSLMDETVASFYLTIIFITSLQVHINSSLNHPRWHLWGPDTFLTTLVLLSYKPSLI